MQRRGHLHIFKHRYKSLGARLTRLYVLLLFIPVVAIGLYGHQYLQLALGKSAVQNGLDEIGVRAMMIDTLLWHIHHDMLYLGQRVDGGEGAIRPADPSEELIGFSAAHPTYQSIAWVGLDGSMRGGHLTDILETWSSSDSFNTFSETSVGSIQFIPYVTDGADGKALLIVAARLENGVLLLEVNSNYLLQGLNTPSPLHEWAVMVETDTYITTAENVNHFVNYPEIFSDASGAVPRNERVMFYHRTGPGSNWVLMYSAPIASVSADLSSYYLTFFLLLGGGLIAVVGLALLAIAWITDPVYQLESMVDQMRHGTARPPLPYPLPNNEFGKLMIAFDQMAAELEENRRNERAVAEQIIRAQEEERKMIAYDLHDGLIQQLVGARFYLGQCRNTCEERLGSRSQSLVRSYDVLTEAITEGRRIIQGLHPTVLEDLGLEAALSELLRDMASAANWSIECDVTSLNPQPDRAASVTLYRITQEALSNVFKHAKAQHVHLTLVVEDGCLSVSIADDGCGFDMSQLSDDEIQHWGIRTMCERAAMLGGLCRIKSHPGEGTTIKVSIPYQTEVMRVHA